MSWPHREPAAICLDAREASQRQALAAIAMFEAGCFDASIILASASEGVLPNTAEKHLFPALKGYSDTDFNFYQNRLKHGNLPEGFKVDEFIAAISILRAITKYQAVYGASVRGFSMFLARARKRGQLPESLFASKSI